MSKRTKDNKKVAFYKSMRKRHSGITDAELLRQWNEKKDAIEAEEKVRIETEKKAKEEAERIAKLPTTTTTTPAPTTTTTTPFPELDKKLIFKIFFGDILSKELTKGTVKDANVSSTTETNITTPASSPVESVSAPVIEASVIAETVIDPNLIVTKPPTE